MFYTVYNVTLEQGPNDNGPRSKYAPLASIHVDKFRITYENGDYEELDDTTAFRKAKAWFRTNLGCKFEGDVNPATGNRVRDVYSESPCNSILIYEKVPFSSHAILP